MRQWVTVVKGELASTGSGNDLAYSNQILEQNSQKLQNRNPTVQHPTDMGTQGTGATPQTTHLAAP